MTVGYGRGGLTEGATTVLPSGAAGFLGREDKTAAQVLTQSHGKYYEAASRQVLFSAVNTTARALSTGLSTTAPIILYNPLNSGKNLAIKRVGFAMAASGTLGTGTMFHCVFTLNGPVASQSGTVPVVGSGAAITIRSNYIGGSASSVAQAFELGTLNAAPVQYSVFLNQSEVAGGTIGGNCQMNFEDVDGSIVLQQGAGWSLQSISAAGSSGAGWFSVVWEELPIS